MRASAPRSLLDWLRDETHGISVFLKDHPPTAYLREVLADRRFLAAARHAFLIRRPGEIAASSYALDSGMNPGGWDGAVCRYRRLRLGGPRNRRTGRWPFDFRAVDHSGWPGIHRA